MAICGFVYRAAGTERDAEPLRLHIPTFHDLTSDGNRLLPL